MSCYGLLDINTVLSPTLTGQYIDMVYSPGFQYAAYRPSDASQVQND